MNISEIISQIVDIKIHIAIRRHTGDQYSPKSEEKLSYLYLQLEEIINEN